jgi:dipeptidyl aminopeptidase/acylaminoacyl peptidase
VRKDLERVEIPNEHEARVRTWQVVEAAFASRHPTEPRRSWRPLVVALAALAAVAAVLSPPGRAVLGEVREVVGVEKADPALFSLPADGRVLVSADTGIWIVQRDGSRRRLGDYASASWSPFGRFVVATRANELAALEPDGEVRWKLSRPQIRFARWSGTRRDTRIAYLSGQTLRVVAGDSTPDVLIARNVAAVAPAWRPGARHVLAFVATDGRVHLVDVDRRRTLLRSQRTIVGPVALEWSRDGSTLLALGTRSVEPVVGGGEPVRLEGPGVALAAAPRGRTFAVVERLAGGRSRVSTLGADARELFAGKGRFSSLEWSPDGAWLLIAWRDADQWVFVRARGAPRLRAASAAAGQFESTSFPRVEGWCCAP